MADVYTRIGYIKGATGATGAQGAKGDQGDAATIQVGTVTTVAYGQTASVVNSGTSGAAVFDFAIPQGRPGEQTTDMQNLTLGSITASSASFPVPAVGETGKVLWGKVVKWFSDMSALVATKLNSANVVNNLTTTASGYALDARQGKALGDLLGDTTTPCLKFLGTLNLSANTARTITLSAEHHVNILLVGNLNRTSAQCGMIVVFPDSAGTATNGFCDITGVATALSRSGNNLTVTVPTNNTLYLYRSYTG